MICQYCVKNAKDLYTLKTKHIWLLLVSNGFLKFHGFIKVYVKRSTLDQFVHAKIGLNKYLQVLSLILVYPRSQTILHRLFILECVSCGSVLARQWSATARLHTASQFPSISCCNVVCSELGPERELLWCWNGSLDGLGSLPDEERHHGGLWSGVHVRCLPLLW